MYKPLITSGSINDPEQLKKAFDNYREDRTRISLFSKEKLEELRNSYNDLINSIDSRIQDFLYLRGYRKIIDPPKEFYLIGLDEDFIKIKYDNFGYWDDAYLPYELLTDPGYLDRLHSKIVEDRDKKEAKKQEQKEAKDKEERLVKLDQYYKLQKELGLSSE